MNRKQAKNKTFSSSTDWSNKKIGIVVADFNSDITWKLLEGAEKFLLSQGFKNENIKVVNVPGSFEIPLMCQSLARLKRFDGLLALGAVIKGDTDHYYYIAGEASRGIMQVMLQESIPIGFGVITVANVKQAKERSDKDNKGVEAAEALLRMIENVSKN